MTLTQLTVLSFSDFSWMADIAIEDDSENAKRNRENAGFTGWLAGATGEKSFNKFCEKYGLTEKVILTPDQKKREKEKTAKMAAEIIMGSKAAREARNGKKRI